MLWLLSSPVNHAKIACLYWKEPVSTRGRFVTASQSIWNQAKLGRRYCNLNFWAAMDYFRIVGGVKHKILYAYDFYFSPKI